MADANRLSTQVTGHTVFEENQVLTSEQLNEVVGYLDRQQRLTRARLQGVGIVCGLQLEMAAAEIKLSQGVAVTTDGDLLNVEENLSFSQFQAFTDQDAQYPHFMVDEITMPLFELVENGGTPLSSFTARTGRQLANMVAVLYLESYFYDPDLCTGSGCDNKGKAARNNLRVLLVDAENAQLLFGDDVYLGRRYPLLEDYSIARPIFDPDNIDDYTDLGTEYRNVILQAIPNLKERLQKTWQKPISMLIGDRYGKSGPIQAWEEKLNSLQNQVQNSLFGAQYLYDFLHDLTQAYNEFKEALFADNFICMPPVELFPKHVLIGGSGDNAVMRHGFYESPQLNRKDQTLARIRFLYHRLDQMIRLYQRPEVAEEIKFTPSKVCCADLGGRAIPYYYQPDKLRPLPASWSFELSQRGLQQNIYGYYAGALGGSATAKEPLNYDLYSYDFFRIEGHLGRDIGEAETDLRQQIEDSNLPIQILTLQIETAFKPWRIRPLAPMRDLKALHRFHRMDLLQQIGNLRKFSAKVATAVEESQDLPDKEVEADSLSYKAFLNINLSSHSQPASSATSDLDGASGVLDEAIEQVGQGLKTSFSEFKFAEFKTNYTSMVNLAAGVNRSIRGVTYASAFTPYELALSDSKFKWLGWIEDLLKKRFERAEELSVFAKFLKEAPAMEHLAGVPKGGTFILVYSGASKRVVADFCLPYWHVDVPEADEQEDQAVEESDFSWVDLNDFMVKRATTKVLAEDVESLKGKFNQYDLRLQGQEDSLRVYSNSLNTYSNTIIDTSKNFFQEGVFDDLEVGRQADFLGKTATQLDFLNEKIGKGSASEAEVAMRDQLEAVSSSLITEKIKQIQEGSKDVLPGSDQEKFMEVAIAASARMSAAEKQSLSTSMVEIQNNAGTKTNMANLLNGMIMK